MVMHRPFYRWCNYHIVLVLCYICRRWVPRAEAAPLKLVDTSSAVCDGGSRSTETLLWLVDMPSLGFVKLGDGACGNRSLAKETKLATPSREGCEAACENDASCAAYDFCLGKQCLTPCRLFPKNRTYNVVVNLLGSECFVKQARNESKPHVISFLRSSNESTSITYVLTDSSPERKTIVPTSNVTFAAFKSRRQLTAVPRRGKGGGGHGHSHSVGRTGSRSHSRSPSTRSTHLASSRSVSGRGSIGRFSSARNPKIGSYGYNSHRLGHNFPAGYRATSYGLSGRSHYLRYSTVMVAWLGGWYWLNRLNHMCHCAIGIACCNVSHSSEGDDNVIFDLDEDLIREDVLTSGFLPEEYTYPLRLTVSNVAGEHYNKSRICPPAGWDSAKSATSASPWIPPPHQELFVSVTQMEDLAPEDPMESFLLLGAFALIGLCAFGVVALGWCINRCSAQKKVAEEEEEQALSSAVEDVEERIKTRKSYAPIPVSVGLHAKRFP